MKDLMLNLEIRLSYALGPRRNPFRGSIPCLGTKAWSSFRTYTLQMGEFNLSVEILIDFNDPKCEKKEL